jgi:hypothetical protein
MTRNSDRPLLISWCPYSDHVHEGESYLHGDPQNLKLCSRAALWRPATTRLITLPPDAFPHNLKLILDGMSG